MITTVEKIHPLNALYLATEGEGVHIGTPQVFVRYQGCAVGCINCDSKDTWDFKNIPMALSLIEILEEIKKFKIKRVSITGGDPLHPTLTPLVLELITALKAQDFYVNIEAAGTRFVPEIFSLVDFISFDYKTPSTGVKTSVELIKKLQSDYSGKFQIKSVVASSHDFFDVKNAYLSLLLPVSFPWVITPAYNPEELNPIPLFKEVIRLNEENSAYFRVILQQHKWLWGPLEKNV